MVSLSPMESFFSVLLQDTSIVTITNDPAKGSSFINTSWQEPRNKKRQRASQVAGPPPPTCPQTRWVSIIQVQKHDDQNVSDDEEIHSHSKHSLSKVGNNENKEDVAPNSGKEDQHKLDQDERKKLSYKEDPAKACATSPPPMTVHRALLVARGKGTLPGTSSSSIPPPPPPSASPSSVRDSISHSDHSKNCKTSLSSLWSSPRLPVRRNSNSTRSSSSHLNDLRSSLTTPQRPGLANALAGVDSPRLPERANSFNSLYSGNDSFVAV